MNDISSICILYLMIRTKENKTENDDLKKKSRRRNRTKL